MGELRLLGPVEVLAHNGLVHAGEPRRLAVLAALTVDAGRVVSTTTLIDRVWGDDPPGQATKTLGTHITRIRRMLEQSFGDSTVTVVNQPGGYRLAVRPDQVDLFRFRELVGQARVPSCGPEQRVDLLRQAVTLHRGDPLTGVEGEWAARSREQLAGELLTARAEWAEAELAVGNTAAVLAPLTTLADANPLVEPLVVALVRALVAAGRPTEALERCRLHREHLAEEYGTDPSPQLRALYETVLRADHQPVEAIRARRTEVPAERQPEAAAAAADSSIPAAPIPAAPRRWRRRPFAVAFGLALTLAVTFGAATRYRPSGPATPAAQTRFTATENFSGTGLDPLQWAAHDTRQTNGSSWSRSMVRVGDGELQITGTGRNVTGSGNTAGSVCWCREHGIIRTYGVWEVRARFDVGTGYAPTIGLYPESDESTPGWGFLTMARLDTGDRGSMYPVFRSGRGEPIDGTPVSGKFTTWNTYAMEWRADFVTVSLNGTVIFDTRKLSAPIAIPSVPMFLYVQVNPGPEGSVPAPNQRTPDRTTTHVDWIRYTS